VGSCGWQRFITSKPAIGGSLPPLGSRDTPFLSTLREDLADIGQQSVRRPAFEFGKLTARQTQTENLTNPARRLVELVWVETPERIEKRG
jgi:hypothetical protein